jgi:hypothetical protein
MREVAPRSAGYLALRVDFFERVRNPTARFVARLHYPTIRSTPGDPAPKQEPAMTSIKYIAAIAIFATLSLATAAQASETLKPMQGVSFHAGSKHAVGYFLNESESCKLVLTLADDANYAPTRFETAIEAGKSTRYQLAEGKSLEFACQAGAQAMIVNPLETSAANR